LASPNPTTDYLTLEVKDFELSNIHFQLYDMNGKLLQSEKITGNQTSIVMSNLVPATYFLKVIVKTQGIASQQEVKTFRVIKKLGGIDNEKIMYNFSSTIDDGKCVPATAGKCSITGKNELSGSNSQQ